MLDYVIVNTEYFTKNYRSWFVIRLQMSDLIIINTVIELQTASA